MSETQKTISGRHFVSERVTVDGRSFADCRFSGCRLVYAGGEPPAIRGCAFDDCRWEFADGAARTLAFLGGLYQGGFESVVEETFAALRGQPTSPAQKPRPPARAPSFASRLAEFPPVRIVKRPKPKES